MLITNDIQYVGVNDHELDLFEGQYTVKYGMSYNSYVILDEKIAIMDSVDIHFTKQWLKNIEQVLNTREPDYFVISHMEPDHSASIAAFVEKYPNVTLVGNTTTFKMLNQFFDLDDQIHKKTVVNQETLSLGKHALTFIFAPMVHWPEVMVSYESYDKVLFSADAFGKFGALDHDDNWVDEARRYYIGIVGKYGLQTKNVLAKAKDLDIKMIAPLHGPVLSENLDKVFSLYQTWANYDSEKDAVLIAYSSIYGHTKEAACQLAQTIQESQHEVYLMDLARCDMAEAVAKAFECDKLVLASVTYNADVFVHMKEFIHHLCERNYQKRTVGLIENGSWAPSAGAVMRKMLEKCKDLHMIETTLTIRSSLKESDQITIKKMSEELFGNK